MTDADTVWSWLKADAPIEIVLSPRNAAAAGPDRGRCRRRGRLVGDLAVHLPGWTVTGAAAGLHLVVHPPPGHDEVALTALAVECGLDARPLSRYTVTPAARPGRVIGYGHQRPNTLAGAVVELAARLR